MFLRAGLGGNSGRYTLSVCWLALAPLSSRSLAHEKCPNRQAKCKADCPTYWKLAYGNALENVSQTNCRGSCFTFTSSHSFTSTLASIQVCTAVRSPDVQQRVSCIHTYDLCVCHVRCDICGGKTTSQSWQGALHSNCIESFEL